MKVHDQSRRSYNIDKQIRFKTLMLQPDLWDYSDAYIVVKGTITVQTENNIYFKMLLKNNAPFINCISKINDLLIDNGKRSFVVPIKKQRTNIRKKITEISKNNDYTTGNLLEYEYFSYHYKLIVIDLNKNYKIIKSWFKIIN